MSYFVLNEVIRRNITNELRKSYPFAKLDVSNVSVNVLNASVQLDTLKVEFLSSTNNRGNIPHFYVPKTKMKGIHFFQFILNKRFIVDLVTVQDARITMDSLLLSRKESILNQIKLPFRKLLVHQIRWENTALMINSAKGSKSASTAIKKLTVTRLEFESAPKPKLLVNKILIDKSETDIFNDTGIDRYLKSFDDDSVSGHVKQIILDNFVVRSHSTENTFSVKGSLQIDELQIDSSRYREGYDFKAIQGKLSNLNYTLKGGLHAVRIKDIDLNSKNESIVLQQIRMVPMLNRDKFFKRLGHQADMIDAEISKVEIIKIDIPALLQKKLLAEKIHIHSVDVHVFRDRRYPRPTKAIPLPMEALRKAPFDIRVKTVQLNPSTVEYEEQPSEGKLTGILRVEKLKFSISPLVNRFRASDNPYLEMKSEGSVMGTGNVVATVLMPIKPGMPYRVEGVFNKLELTRLNSSSENLGKIRIKSGFLDFLYFQFTMTEKESAGKIIGAYQGLVIQQLKKHSDEKKVAKIPSFMLRNFIIPLNKPASLPERKRTGDVRYKHDPSRMFSYYLLQSLLTGVKSSFTLGFLLPK